MESNNVNPMEQDWSDVNNALSSENAISQAKKARILLVEDDINLLEGVRNILELDHYDVLTAENGLEALEILRAEISPPDLILSDIMMPRMDGIRLLEEVRKEQSWVSIPFIYLTAKGEKVDIQKGKLLGVDDYVVKPYDPDYLLVAIKSRLDRHRKLNDYYSAAMNELKQSILTILNHEFRTPLTFVVAYADMLSSPQPQQLSTSELQDYLRGVSVGAERLRRLIENFILLVELETSDAHKTYQVRKAPINDLHTILVSAWTEVANRDGVTHGCDIQIQEALPMFWGDEQYLKRALVQLLDNAVKFSPDSKKVTSGARVENKEVCIWVQDYGRGIPSNEHRKIMESFYQINRPVNEDQGAGAGLAIVKGVVKLHSGRITITSAPGEGSIFSIYLPMMAADSLQ
jgi:DNA-binding response OmpR family regulator